jgi:hypothetical protein
MLFHVYSLHEIMHIIFFIDKKLHFRLHLFKLKKAAIVSRSRHGRRAFVPLAMQEPGFGTQANPLHEAAETEDLRGC